VAEPVPLSGLSVALALGDHELVSLVGGGGKTTTLLALGRQLAGRVLLTTTTRMGQGQAAGVATLTGPTDHDIVSALSANGSVFVRRAVSEGKSVGVTAEQCDRWLELADHVVVEADGSRMRPFTAPRPHEPVVPSLTTTLVACIGADALGRVIADQCHTPMRVAAVAGCSPYRRLTPERAARVILSDRGSRKRCPPGARFVVLVTKVDEHNRALVDELVEAVGARAAVVPVLFDPSARLDYGSAR
jgi:probable selenium-dependent hydroxylase accessory protein YqeC